MSNLTLQEKLIFAALCLRDLGAHFPQESGIGLKYEGHAQAIDEAVKDTARLAWLESNSLSVNYEAESKEWVIDFEAIRGEDLRSVIDKAHTAFIKRQADFEHANPRLFPK